MLDRAGMESHRTVSTPLHSPSPRSLRTPRRFDPRALVVATVAVVAAALATPRGVPAMLGLLGFVCAGHAFVTRRAAATARVLVRLAPFALLIVVVNAVLAPGDTLVSIAGRRIVSREGLEDGVFFALRLGVMLTAVSTLLAGASPESLARAVHDAVRRVSERAAKQTALFVFLAMGFVPLFADEFERIRVAQAFRGGEFAGGPWRRAGAVRAWLVPLILSAVHRSSQLAFAVELRDVRNRLPHTIDTPRTRAADVVLLALTAAWVVAAFTVG
jgi:energy-coupling factor transporter transmembrane protein EcfT